MNTSYHDLGKPISNIVQDLNYSGTEPIKPCNYSYNPVPWLLFEFLFSVYSITILVVTFMRHRHHLEPVHLLTLSALLDLIFLLVNYLIMDILLLAWPNLVYPPLDFTFLFCFYLDLIVGELNGFIFVRWDVYYYDWITNNRTILVLAINKLLGVLIVGLTSLALPSAKPCDDICFLGFSPHAFYFSSLPFFLYFILAIPIMFYMCYKTYSFSKIQPQPNISGQIDEAEQARVILFIEKMRKYLKSNIYSLLIISFNLPANCMIIIIRFWDLKCENWGSFVEIFMFFQSLVIFIYPYFVKLKLNKFHS